MASYSGLLTTTPPQTPEQAEAWIRRAVEHFGPGFHPDTSGVDLNVPRRLVPRYDINRAAVAALIDPYAVALEAVEDALRSEA